MGRLTEAFAILKAKDMPQGKQVSHYYHHIDVNTQREVIKKLRAEHRKNKKS